MKVSLEKSQTLEELAHVGVKGMRWGVRRKRRRSAYGQMENGKIFVSKLSEDQWNQKINNQKTTYRQLDTASRSMAKRGQKPR